MSKKLHSSGNPRKFIDKIALIKQKEALTNAYFESAIQGLSDISMKRIASNDDFKINNENNAYPVENNFSILKDNFSNASVSPQSFTSDSTSNNPQFDNYLHSSIKQFKDPNNDVFKSLYENQNVECGIFQTLQTHGGVKYRHGSDNSTNQFPQARLSNIESYSPYHNILVRNLDEQVCSESLPDVSSLNNRNYVYSNFDQRHSSGSQHSKELPIQDPISFKKVKKGSSSKRALFEHLRSRGVQNLHNQHVLSSDQIASNLPVNHGSPSLNRSRGGYIHNNDNLACAATNNENGHLKHYLPSSSPYLSLPIRDTHINKDCDSSLRKRHASNNINSQPNQMELQLNCTVDMNNYGFKYKSLTPTENVQTNWFTNPNLLPPMVFGMMSADNYRRVSSDSSIQKSLDQNANISQSNFLYNNDQNLNRRNQHFQNDPKVFYQRIKSMTNDPCSNIHQSLNEAPNHFNLQRDDSTSSSFLDNYIDTNSIDENLDPNIDFAITPGNVPCQPFKFVEINNLPIESEVNKSDNYGCENQQMSEQNDQCYWTQETESNPFSKEPSPKIKPCENLDLKSISVDLNTDFSCLPDIVLSDTEVPRRDSLNMADEVLSNLSMDSCSSELLQYRDKLTGYQPMDMLTEENLSKNFENEY